MSKLEKVSFSCSYEIFNKKVSPFFHSLGAESFSNRNNQVIYYYFRKDQEAYVIKKDRKVICKVNLLKETYESLDKILKNEKI